MSATSAGDTPGVARVALGIVGAVVVASVVNLAVAAVTHAAGASDDFAPLMPGPFIFFTAVGTLIATAGWAWIRRSDHAASTLQWLAPAVLLISFVPDLLVGAGQTMAGTSWTAVVGLMVMHVVVAAVVVGMLVRVLPVQDRVAAGARA